jgi:spartin
MHPAYKNSRIVSKAAAASRLLVTTSSYVGQALQSQADGFTQRTKPTSKPLTFNPTTHARIRRIHTFSEGAAGLSAKTVAQVQKYAQNLGAMARRSESQRAVKGIGPDGQPVENYKPGILNKSIMAFSTVADGIDQAARNLLASTSTAATTVVGHKFGPEAGEISRSLSGGLKNVALVYIDASGVSRRAIVKSVAKGMVVGKVRGGGDLVVGGGDGGGDGGQAFAAPPQNWKEKEAAEGRYVDDPYMHGGRESLEMVGFGRATSAYGTERRESL